MACWRSVALVACPPAGAVPQKATKTLAHNPERSESNEEPGPDSVSMRVSLNTAYESGIPPARDRLALGTESDAALEQLELVMVESTRAEANMGLLLRGLKHLAAGASAAQE